MKIMLRRGSTAIAIAAFAVTPIIGAVTPGNPLAPTAHAAITGFANTPEASTIDMNRAAKLTVIVPDTRQYEVPDKTDLPRGGVEGYTITIKQLDVAPINTTAGYTAAAALKAEEAKGLRVLSEKSGVTDANGVVYFDDLKPGAYLITATVPADSTAYFPTPQDMVLVVPTVGETGAWNYDINLVTKFNPQDCVCPPPEPGKPDKPCEPPTPPTPEVPWEPPNPDKPGKPGKPGNPGDPGKPPTPGKPGKPAEPGKPGKSGSLPITGVQVIGLAGLSAVLIGAGFAALAAAHKKRSKGTGA